MGVGALSERLALLVDLNPESAVHGLKKVGDAADKELGKTQDHLDRLGGKLQTAGVGMVAFGATALFTLEHFAKAAEEAEVANLKLDNSIEHSAGRAGESAKPFQDLAESLQQTTEYSHVATTGMEAYLIQVGLTKDQVLKLTPAIQDLAAKADIPLEDAAKKVVMALNGKKKGLEALLGPLDAATYATDRYKAVTEALTKVQGFAATQGKTFEGQLTILGNNLKELEEGVGVGVVDAFSKMFGGVEAVTGAINSLSPGAQSMTGEILTFGAAGLVAAGALSTIAGTAIKVAGPAISTLTGLFAAESVAAEEAAVSTGVLGGAMGPIGLIGAGLGLITVLGGLFSGETKTAGATEDYTKAIENQTGALSDNIDAVSSDKLAHSDAARAANAAGVSYKSMFDAIRTGTDDFGRYSQILKSASNDDTITVKGLHDSLVAAGAGSTEFGRGLLQIADSGSLTKDQLSGYAHLIEQLHNDYGTGIAQAHAYAAATGDVGGAAHDSAADNAAFAASIKDVHDALHASIDPAFAYEQALIDNRKAQADATAAQKDASKSADEIQQANFRAAESALKVKDAAGDLAVALKANPALAADVSASLNDLAGQGFLTKEQVDQLTWSIGTIPTDKQILITADTGQAESALSRVLSDEQNALTFGARLVGLHFADGGMVPGPRGAPQLAVVHGGEYVLTADEADAANGPLVAGDSATAGTGGTTVIHDETHVHFHIGTVIGEERAVLGVLEQAASKGFTLGPQTKRMFANT